MVDEISEVKIGAKEIQKYVYSVLRNSKILMKARGVNIKKCVDVSLICVRDYNYKIDAVRLYNSSYKDETERERNISNIEINLSKE